MPVVSAFLLNHDAKALKREKGERDGRYINWSHSFSPYSLFPYFSLLHPFCSIFPSVMEIQEFIFSFTQVQE